MILKRGEQQREVRVRKNTKRVCEEDKWREKKNMTSIDEGHHRE